MSEQLNNPEEGINEKTPEERIMGMLDDDLMPVEPKDELKEEPEVIKSEEENALPEGPETLEPDPKTVVPEEGDSEEVTFWTVPKAGENGEDIEVAEDELVNGYLRQADYTRKTQATADKDRALESERNDLMQSRQSYIDALLTFQQQSSNDLEKFKDVNWSELREEDSEKWLLMKAEQTEIKERIKLADEDKVTAQQEQQGALLTQYKEIASREYEILTGPDGIDDWGKEKEGGEIRGAMKTYALSAGYTEDELKILIDHRALIILNKARKFDEIQGKSKILISKRKGKVVPKLVKPGAIDISHKQNEVKSKLAKRLSQSGTVHDAAAVMFENLDDDLLF